MEKNEAIREQSCDPLEANAEDLVSELAWEYCQKSRNGENPIIAAYLQKLEKKDHLEFQRLVTLDTLIDTAIDFQNHIAMKG